jgi:hypothetical protein
MIMDIDSIWSSGYVGWRLCPQEDFRENGSGAERAQTGEEFPSGYAG